MSNMPCGDGLEKWRDKGVNEKNVVFACDDFVVFLDDELDVDWISDSGFDHKLDEIQKDPTWGKINSDIMGLQSVEIEHLTRTKRVGFRRQLGTAMQLALSNDLPNASKTLGTAHAFLQKCQMEVSKARVLEASTGAAFVITVIALLFLLFRVKATLVELAVCACGGAWGSWFSISLRLTKLELDPTDGRYLHYLEASRRILAGAVAGPIVFSGAKIGLIFSFAAQGGLRAAAVVGVFAGLWEWCLPSMLKRFRADTSTKSE